MDLFRVHRMDFFRDQLKEKNIHTFYIPGGECVCCVPYVRKRDKKRRGEGGGKVID